MTGATTRVFIVEDSPPIRERLIELLGAVQGVDIVGSAATPGEGIAGIARTRPHCVVLDYQLEGGTGLEVLRALCPQLPATRFVVLTNHASPQLRAVCVEAGADAYYDKSTEFDKVREVVEGIVPGQD